MVEPTLYFFASWCEVNRFDIFVTLQFINRQQTTWQFLPKKILDCLFWALGFCTSNIFFTILPGQDLLEQNWM